jgi:iron complex transport system substrate-binding protein
MSANFTRRGFIAASSAALAASALARPALAQGATKSITTIFGSYDVPLEPKRIVLMGNRTILETTLALDLPRPVAMGFEYAFTDSHHQHVAPWVPFDPEDDVEIFNWAEVTAEQILSYEPDLILARRQEAEWMADRFPAISRIAPVIPVGDGAWREDLERIAGWLDRTDQLARTFAEHDTQRDALKAKYGDKITNSRMAFGSIEPPVVWLASLEADVPAAQSLKDLGGQIMPWPSDLVSKDFPEWFELSPENLGILGDSDAILFWAPTRAILDEFVSTTPLWARLPQVADGRATLAPNNVGSGSVYTIMETLRLWDQVYGTLA